MTYWDSVSGPVEKVLVEHADRLVILGAATALAPLALLAIVTLLRAVGDLRFLTTCQAISLATLLGCASATLVVTEGPMRDFVLAAPGRATAAWDTVSDPIEKVLQDYSSIFVLCAAATVLLPLSISAVVIVLRFLKAILSTGPATSGAAASTQG